MQGVSHRLRAVQSERALSLAGPASSSVLWVRHPKNRRSETAALDVHEWKNVVNEMDLLFLAYGRLGEGDVNNTMRSLLATTVSRLAMWGLDVAERLLGEDDDKIIDPVRVLRSIAREEGWTCTTPADWALGTASATGAIHAARAALDEPPRVLHRRIWSAQASVVVADYR